MSEGEEWIGRRWWQSTDWMINGRWGRWTSMRDSGWGCWGFFGGVLPACEGGGHPGPRGCWRGGPLSSSLPPAPGSAVQTAPPALWPTPAEPLRSHTAPYTLHGPKGKEGRRYTHTQPRTHHSTGRGCLTKTDTHPHTNYNKIQWMLDFLGWYCVKVVILFQLIYLLTCFDWWHRWRCFFGN